MKIIAEHILSDDRVATMRQVLAGDWLMASALPDGSTDVALILTITRIDNEPLTSEVLKNLPLEDYFLLAHSLKKEFDRIAEYVPVFSKDLK